MNTAIWNPSQEFMESTRLYQWMKELGFDDFDDFLKASCKDIEWFWHKAEKALGIEWFQDYQRTLDLEKGIKWPKWYVGGQLNVVHNSVDKWANHPLKKHYTALICESEDGQVKRYSYAELSRSVANVAAGLQRQGLTKGDRVGIFMPMIYETAVAILAIARIGAIFCPSFSGYAAEAVSKRLNASTAKMLITVDGFYRRGKIVAMKEEADEARMLSPSVEKTIVVSHIGRDVPWHAKFDVSWHELQDGFERDAPLPQATAMHSSDACMLLYTSGTTGSPKGAVHTHAGFPLKAAFDAGFGMDLKEKDVLFWITDMGWMMGPFLIFGALLNGATSVLYEGSVDYPHSKRLWHIVEDHKVTHLGLSPTLVRLLMKEEQYSIDDYDLSALRLICSTGEPWNLEPWMWLFKHIGKSQIPIFNFSGGTEISGGVLGNILLKPISPITFNSPLPGMDIDVFDEHGRSLRNAIGELVIKQPWVGITEGFWQEDERYEETYFGRWPNIWMHSDSVMVDEGGFWTITGRSDDTLKVAGKRIGAVEIESILVGHDLVREAAVIGAPDELKGEAAVCFVVLKKDTLDPLELKEELLDLVADKLGKCTRPQELYFVKDFPKTRNGKVLRRTMRAAYLNLEIGDLSAIENMDSINCIRALQYLTV